MRLFLISFILLVAGCSSHEIIPENVKVKVSRDAAAKDCKHLGPVLGRSSKISATSQEVLEDMKKEAAKMGANYIQYDSASAIGTAMRGHAYYCP